MSRSTLFASLLASLAGLSGCGSDAAPIPATQGLSPDAEPFLAAPASCAYHCPVTDCAEKDAPYECPALGAWDTIPHLEACPSWDGSYPASKAGQCSATEPTGAAQKRPGPDGAARILPDGRRATPAGDEWVFNEPDILSGTTTAACAVPGTRFVLTVDTGNNDHAVRAIDTDLLGSGDPVTGRVKFGPPSYLTGAITFVPPDRAYVSTSFGQVQALAFDPATGSLGRADERSIALPPSKKPNTDGEAPWFTSGVAASPDGKRLVVTAVVESRVLVYDIDPASAAYGQELGEVDLGDKQTFGVYFDPHDPSGSVAYVPVWGGKKVVEIDLADPAAPKLGRAFATDENPQGIAFLDGRWMAVANDLGETISLVDRVSGAVTQVLVEYDGGLHGLDVSSLAYDASSKRLYATLAGINAIAAYDVDLGSEAPAFTPAGKLQAGFWPSGVAVSAEGDLVVVNLRGQGIGPNPIEATIGEGGGDERMRGSVQRIAAPSAQDLQKGEASVGEAVAVGAQAGYPTVECPPGVNDFPVPRTNTEGPSPVIQHIVFIVRENKTFDALLGDLPGVDGEPSYTMKKTTADMDRVWTNFRGLARTFVTSDNFYNLAVKSTQGHTWTTYGRATDFDERTWSDDARPVPLSGISDVGRPVEGSLFEWLQSNGVVYDILGEIVGNPRSLPEGFDPIDVRYPGGPAQNITFNDLQKACYTSGRARVACNLGSFVYMTLPNDHTVGVSPDNPAPEVMCSVNDEATGMIVDALSHSPFWASTLVVITEDDPQQGGDHVDYHRTPLVLVSPWVKRGYVSKTHIDVASLHKLFAHLLGLPYSNLIVESAGLPLDAFTSTPDYTPYDYVHRQWPLQCGDGASGAERRLTSSWDFSLVDEQPGLGDQVSRWMRGKQLTELPPALEAEVAARLQRQAAGLPPLEADDDD